MHVRFISGAIIDTGTTAAAGDIFDIPEALARALIAQRIAVSTEPLPVAPPENPLVSEIAISGAQDGVNCVFTLAITPALLILARNGQFQRAGDGRDFVLSGATITFDKAPLGDPDPDWLLAIGY